MSKDKIKKEKIIKTELKPSEILNGIDNAFNMPGQAEQEPVSSKKDKQNGNEPLIIRIENYINEKYNIRLDEVRNILEVKKKEDKEFKKDEKFEANLTANLLRDGYKGVSSVVKTLLGSDFITSYHPVRQYFNNLGQWDGFDRITQLTTCLKASSKEEQAILHKHFKKHLIRCVISAFRPGFFNKHCFVIVGTGQSMGKTSFIRYLVPDELKSYVTDAMLDWKDKDANIALGSNWMINLDELANLNRDETNSLKATLSRDNIKVRRPYDRVESEIPRLANFFGSTNDLQFLTDLTGNVRWIMF